MLMLDKLIGIAIDAGVFYSVNEILNAAGVKYAKADMSDVVIYTIIDALVKNGYLVQGDIQKELSTWVAKTPGKSGIRARDAYVGLLSALGMIAFDSLQRKKLVILGPLIKASAGQLGNVFVDEALGLSRIN